MAHAKLERMGTAQGMPTLPSHTHAVAMTIWSGETQIWRASHGGESYIGVVRVVVLPAQSPLEPLLAPEGNDLPKYGGID